MPSSSSIDIQEWRASLSLPNTAPTSHRYPILPSSRSQPHTQNHSQLSHQSSSSAESKQRAPPSLHLSQPHSNHSIDASSAGEDTDASSGSETESQKAVKSAKKEEADRLVDSTLSLLLSLWPVSSPDCPLNGGKTPAGDDTVPLRTFVNEILRRSRSSCATLRAAKWYLERASVLLPPAAERKSTLVCARRTFLSALILANKFMHDRVYSNRAWSRVSGLAVTEVSKGEAALGNLLSWSLWVGRSESNDVTPSREAHLALSAPLLIPIPPTPITTSTALPSSTSPSGDGSSATSFSPASSVLESPVQAPATASAKNNFGLELLLEQAKVLQQQQKKEQEEKEQAEVEDAHDHEEPSPYRPLLLAPLAGPLAAPASFFSISNLLGPKPTAPLGSHLDLLAHRSPAARRLVPAPTHHLFNQSFAHISPSTITHNTASSLSPTSSPSSAASFPASFENEEDDDDDGSLSTTSSSIETESDVDLLHASEDVNSEDGEHVALALAARRGATSVGGKRRFDEVSSVSGGGGKKRALSSSGGARAKRQKRMTAPTPTTQSSLPHQTVGGGLGGGSSARHWLAQDRFEDDVGGRRVESVAA